MTIPAQGHEPAVPKVVPPEGTDASLADLGVSAADLSAAVERGQIAASNVTRFHPVTAAGLVRWIETVGALRELLVRRGGWEPSDVENRPVLRHPGLGLEIAVTGGTSQTGSLRTDAHPQAARRKGRATQQSFRNQLTLFPAPGLDLSGSPGARGRGTGGGSWFLLYHWDGEEVRMELSQPTGCTDGQFDGWITRIPLPAWVPEQDYRKAQDVGGEDVDFEIA